MGAWGDEGNVLILVIFSRLYPTTVDIYLSTCGKVAKFFVFSSR